jgi:RNA polymerase sigma-70 factor (ECF subfamily)
VLESLVMAAENDQGPLDQRIVAELPGVRAFLRRLAGAGGGRGDVEDLVQEVVARALRYREAFDPARALGPWLRGTALRTFLDHRAERLRAPLAIEGEELGALARSLERVEQRDSVERALVLLSGLERDVLLRFHARGDSIREIARALAMPEGTVKSHLHRARKKLAEDRR